MKRAVFRWGGTFAVVAIVALFFGLRVPHSLAALRGKHEQIRQLQKENADLATDVARKREHIRKLKASPAEQEFEIRNRLKLQREGETSIIIEQEKPAAPAR